MTIPQENAVASYWSENKVSVMTRNFYQLAFILSWPQFNRVYVGHNE